MIVKVVDVTLCAILVTSLPLQTMAAPTAGVVSATDLREAVGAVSRVFLAGKQRAVNFTVHSAGALLESLAKLPVALDETHERLKAARNNALNIRENSESYIIETAERLGELNNRVFNLVRSCPQNTYTCTQCDSIDLTVPKYEPMPELEIEPLAPRPPVASEDLRRLEDIMTSLMQPVPGVNDVIEDLINAYGENTQVNLRDLMNVVQGIALQVEDKRIEILKKQIASMKTASGLLKAAYHHAHGIYSDAAWLDWAVSNPDRTLGEALTHELETFSSFIRQMECVV